MIFNGFPEVSDLLMPQQLADAIMNLLPDSSAKELKEEFKSYQHWVKSDEQSEPKVDDEATDFRFNWLLVRNFRRYDEVDVQPDAHFGMKLQDENGNLCSKLFVLGQNGVGKSTLFNAAEYLFTGRISEAIYRSQHDLEAYIGGHSRGKEDIAVVTTDQRILRETPEIPLPLSRFFISENSILEASGYIADQDNWYSFFCEMLGVGEAYRLINQTLRTIKEAIEGLGNLAVRQQQRYERLLLVLDVKRMGSKRERNSLKELIDDLDLFLCDPSMERMELLWHRLRLVGLTQTESLRTGLKTAKYQLLKMDEGEKQTHLSLDSKADFGMGESSKEQRVQVVERLKQKVLQLKDLLKWLIDSLSTDPSLSHLEQALMKEFVQEGGSKTANPLISKEELNQYIDSTVEDIKNYCQSAQKALNKFVSRFVDQSFKQALEGLYADRFLEKGEKFTIDIDQLTKHEIKITIGRGSLETQPVPANRYFNMFRFRLFFLSVQSILCIKMMQETGISFPLLFDDVFYANDYINKQQLVRFFQMLDDFVAKNDRVKGRMQLIFFSHDEQLVSVIHNEWPGIADGTMYARMVDPSVVSSYSQSICPVKTTGGEWACCQVILPIYTKQNLVWE